MRALLLAMTILTTVSCVNTPKYSSPTSKNTSKIKVIRSLKQYLLGSTTHIYKLATFRDCDTSLVSNVDNHFMTLTRGNPLVSEFNPDGVLVPSGEPLALRFLSIGGNDCQSNIEFTPKENRDYELQVTGTLIGTASCTVRLRSTEKGSPKKTKESFDKRDHCNYSGGFQ